MLSTSYAGFKCQLQYSMVMMYCFKKENEIEKQKFGTQTVQIWTVDNSAWNSLWGHV